MIGEEICVDVIAAVRVAKARIFASRCRKSKQMRNGLKRVIQVFGETFTKTTFPRWYPFIIRTGVRSVVISL